MSAANLSPYSLTSLSGPGPIAGPLSIGNAGANLFSNINSPGAIGANYAGAYNSALQANQANYQNILKGYQQTMGNQVGAQGAISGGYNNLYNTVLGTLGVGQGGAVGAGGATVAGGNWGVATPAAQAIADTYASQQGQTTQGLLNSGLGNTTVLGNMQRGVSLDAAKAYGSLGAQLAQTAAGYESSLGQAGLNYANQANMQNTALAGQQLGFMQGVQIPYPSASAYGGLISSSLARSLAGAGGGQGFINRNTGQQPMQGGGNLGGTGGATGGGVAGPTAMPRPGAQPQTLQYNPATGQLERPASTTPGAYGTAGTQSLANSFGGMSFGGNQSLADLYAQQAAERTQQFALDQQAEATGQPIAGSGINGGSPFDSGVTDAQGNTVDENGYAYSPDGTFIGQYAANGSFASAADLGGG